MLLLDKILLCFLNRGEGTDEVEPRAKTQTTEKPENLSLLQQISYKL